MTRHSASSTGRQAMTLDAVIATVALSLTAVIIGTGHPQVALEAWSALVLGVVVWRMPILAVLIVLLCEEYDSGSQFIAAASSELTLGYQFLNAAHYGVSAPLAYLVIGVISARRRHQYRAAETTTRLALALSLCLAILTLLLYISVRLTDLGPSVATTGLRLMTPWLLLVCSLWITSATLAQRAGRALVLRVLTIAVSFFGLIGLIALAHHGGVQVDSQSNVLFFDAATPFLASAPLLSGLLWRQSSRWYYVLAVAGGLVVLFSFRRSVWLAVIVAMLLVPLITNDLRILRRAVAAIALGALAILLVPSQVSDNGFARATAAVDVAGGQASSDTAAPHASDVAKGFQLVRQQPFTGLGVVAAQPLEFINDGATFVYVHDEYLEDWLRLGLPGALAVAGLVLLALALGVTRLRHADGDTLSQWGGVLLVTFAIPIATAPFLSTTNRWPVILGLLLAVGASQSQPRDVPTESAAFANV